MTSLRAKVLTVAACAVAASLCAPATVWAVDAFTNVAIEDPSNGFKAHIDSSGRVQVADRPLPSATPFSAFVNVSLVTNGNQVRQPIKPLTSPTLSAIQLTNVTVSVPSGSSTLWATVRIEELAPAEGQSTCAPTLTTTATVVNTLYEMTVVGGSPVTITFPTPLQMHGAVALGPLCLGAHIVSGNATADVDGSGYFGS